MSASDDIIHDTLASIDDTVQVSAGVVINAAEATSVTPVRHPPQRLEQGAGPLKSPSMMERLP